MKIHLEKYLNKFMNTKGLVIILLIGVGLLLLPGMGNTETSPATTEESTASFYNRKEYEKELEKRLEEILSTVRGISHVSVMITLEDTGELYYARNTTASEKQTRDGSLDEASLEAEESTALRGSTGNKQTPILLKTALPEIAGVLVTAKGVDTPSVQNEVSSAIRAVLNVPPHRIQVLSKP